MRRKSIALTQTSTSLIFSPSLGSADTYCEIKMEKRRAERRMRQTSRRLCAPQRKASTTSSGRERERGK